MQPPAGLGAQVGDAVEVVDDAGVGGPGAGDDGADRPSVEARRAPAAVEPVALVAGDLDDVEVEQGGGAVAPTSAPTGRRRRRARPAPAWPRRHSSRATARPLRLPAEPPETKQPPVPAGMPASDAEPVEGGVLGGDGGTGLLPALAGERPRPDDGVEQRRRRRRGGRDVGEEAGWSRATLFGSRTSSTSAEGGVDADARRRDRGERGDLVRRRRAPERGSGRTVAADAAPQLGGEAIVLGRPAVELHCSGRERTQRVGGEGHADRRAGRPRPGRRRRW